MGRCQLLVQLVFMVLRNGDAGVRLLELKVRCAEDSRNNQDLGQQQMATRKSRFAAGYYIRAKHVCDAYLRPGVVKVASKKITA